MREESGSYVYSASDAPALDADNACCRYHFDITLQGGRLAATESYQVKTPLLPTSEIALWKAVESAAARAAASKVVPVSGN